MNIEQWQCLPGESWLVVNPLVVSNMVAEWYNIMPHECLRQSLFLGTKLDSLGDHAPQLCQDPNGQWLSYLLTQWPDAPWGLALRSAVPMYELTHHLQSFIKVYDPDGEAVMWRYYDPRILAPTLQAFTPQERQTFLSPFYHLATPGTDASVTMVHQTQQPEAAVCYRQAPWLTFTPAYIDALTERNHRQRIRECILSLRTEIPYHVLEQNDHRLAQRIEYSWGIARTLWPQCDHASQDRFVRAHLQLPSHFYAHPECQQRLQQRGETLNGLLAWANAIDWQPLWQQYHDPQWPQSSGTHPPFQVEPSHGDTMGFSTTGDRLR